MTRRLVGLASCSLALALFSCSNAPPSAESVTTPTEAPATAPVVTAGSTAAPPTTPSTSLMSSPTAATTTMTPTTGGTAPPPLPCAPSGDHVTTSSGRRALLRADGIRGPAPTIGVLHGYTGTPTGIERYAELTSSANQAGVAVAYPEGTPTTDGGFGWASGASTFATRDVDDVAALAEVLDALAATGCVDPAGVVLVGESNGGGMALAGGCAPLFAGRIARLVLVNAAVDAGVLGSCVEPSVNLPITVVAGQRDETVPLAGDEHFLPVTQWSTDVAGLVGGCRDVHDAAPHSALVSRRIGVDCVRCAELLVIADGTHTWPGSSEGVGGLIPGTLELNDLLIAAARDGTRGCLSGAG